MSVEIPNGVVEIERKFLVKPHWPKPAQGKAIKQGYLAVNSRLACRIRQYGEEYWLSVKAGIDVMTRHEFEYQVPEADGMLMLVSHCETPPLEKIRYLIEHDGLTWEIDEFEGVNAGLVVAEVELSSPTQAIALPDWIGEEVTEDPRYLNTQLSKHPFSTWTV